jgi:hypothetical protein
MPIAPAYLTFAPIGRCAIRQSCGAPWHELRRSPGALWTRAPSPRACILTTAAALGGRIMGDAYRYADPAKLADTGTMRALIQAAITAHATIDYALRKVNPEDFATHPDWRTVQAELSRALAAAGHPAGHIST